MRAIFVFFGGQRQWARLALALAQGAPVPLLDEPTTFLDPAHAISFWSSFASKPALVRQSLLCCTTTCWLVSTPTPGRL